MTKVDPSLSKQQSLISAVAADWVEFRPQRNFIPIGAESQLLCPLLSNGKGRKTEVSEGKKQEKKTVCFFVVCFCFVLGFFSYEI